jgi:hypothetical protein
MVSLRIACTRGKWSIPGKIIKSTHIKLSFTGVLTEVVSVELNIVE